MSAPSSDRAGIRQTIRALLAAGYRLVEVFDGEETTVVATEKKAIEAILAVDDAHLFVRDREGAYNPWVRFVMGNEPFEVICDHSTSLSPVLDPLTRGWGED